MLQLIGPFIIKQEQLQYGYLILDQCIIWQILRHAGCGVCSRCCLAEYPQKGTLNNILNEATSCSCSEHRQNRLCFHWSVLSCRSLIYMSLYGQYAVWCWFCAGVGVVSTRGLLVCSCYWFYVSCCSFSRERVSPLSGKRGENTLFLCLFTISFSTC